jgi:predicted ATPase
MKLKNTFIRSIHIQNYRSLKQFYISPIVPFTVFLGKNGSGKSTILDSLLFLSASVQEGLRKTCNEKGGIFELLSKDSSKSFSICIELYDDISCDSLEYFIDIAHDNGIPYVKKETVTDLSSSMQLLCFESGKGVLRFTDKNILQEKQEQLVSRDILALSIFANLYPFHSCQLLYQFLLNLRVFDFQVHNLRKVPMYVKNDSLSQTGDNIATVLYSIQKNEPDTYKKIVSFLQEHIPSLDTIESRHDPVLNTNQIFMTDKGFHHPIGSKYISSGTLKMLAYYILLLQPNEYSFIGLEEPENYIHPSFIDDLTEFCRETSEHKQIVISTHSPFFVNSMQPNEVWACKRNKEGITICDNLQQNEPIRAYVENGAKIGHLWSEGYVEE